MATSTPPPLSLAVSPALAPAHGTARTRLTALLQLTKPRLAFFSILSAMAAYAAAAPGLGYIHLLLAFAGISLSAGGALSFNQWWERRIDGRMRRTASRPLPQGAVSPRAALTFSMILCAAGPALLAFTANPVSAALAALIIVLYGLVYTPMKRRSLWATEVGSVSGALPPLLGAAAAGDVWNTSAWMLAVLLLFWQMPHFYGIGWMHRDDYRAAGFRLLPALDSSGGRTARRSFVYTVLLAAFAPVPWLAGWAGPVYALVAVPGALFMLARARAFLQAPEPRAAAARALFLASVLYLPPLFAAVVLDRFLF